MNYYAIRFQVGFTEAPTGYMTTLTRRSLHGAGTIGNERLVLQHGILVMLQIIIVINVIFYHIFSFPNILLPQICC